MLGTLMSHGVVYGVHADQRVMTTLGRLSNTKQRRYVAPVAVETQVRIGHVTARIHPVVIRVYQSLHGSDHFASGVLGNHVTQSEREDPVDPVGPCLLLVPVNAGLGKIDPPQECEATPAIELGCHTVEQRTEGGHVERSARKREPPVFISWQFSRSARQFQKL